MPDGLPYGAFQATAVSLLKRADIPPVDRYAQRSASMAAAPPRFHRIPERFMRCCTTWSIALSMAPLPTSSPSFLA